MRCNYLIECIEIVCTSWYIAVAVMSKINLHECHNYFDLSNVVLTTTTHSTSFVLRKTEFEFYLYFGSIVYLNEKCITHGIFHFDHLWV